MATYDEIKGIESNNSLLAKVEVALWIAIRTIATEAVNVPDHAGRVAWAVGAVKDTKSEAQRCIRIALAANPSATVSQILAATDASIQTTVNDSIKLLAGIAT